MESNNGTLNSVKKIDIPIIAEFEGSFAPKARPATSLSLYTSGVITVTLLSYKTIQLGAYIGISNIVLLSVFINATVATMGGHLNPTITLSAVLAGICPAARGFFYLCGQLLGSALASGLLMGIFGRQSAVSIQGDGCFYDSIEISAGQAFLNEILESFDLLFLGYGVGLDQRQALLFGPRLGTIACSVVLRPDFICYE
ncbi:hypothetical protein jhhlp_008240 [Lomentospora prolificans]|uniref:Aquaporin n=1 Tax=Lomentospora prolificans TaxID=41688 RepID=A0A2N3MXH9_9PEZI|nr:hypothetical protein jhhlp_008240 [Lomentospora prolificans]